MLLDDIKIILRISNTAYNTEINDLIAACKLELQMDGVSEVILDAFIADSTTDDLLKRIFSVYVKAHFGWDNPESEQLIKVYEMLRNRLTLSLEYAYFSVTINTTEQQRVTFDGVVKETNDSGSVIFNSLKKNHVQYIVAGTEYHADITADTIIEVT